MRAKCGYAPGFGTFGGATGPHGRRNHAEMALLSVGFFGRKDGRRVLELLAGGPIDYCGGSEAEVPARLLSAWRAVCALS